MPKSLSYAQWSLEPYCIGMKLRALRTQKHMTLSRLAAETGLSTALLSKLETERMIPTLPTLAGICRVYGVGMSHFFCEPTRHTLSITRKAHLEGSGHLGEPARHVPLNAPSEKPCLNAELIELTGVSFTPDDAGTEVCAFLYVLEGEVQLTTNGLTQEIGTGDCAYIESRMPTSMTAKDGERCRILLIRPAKR